VDSFTATVDVFSSFDLWKALPALELEERNCGHVAFESDCQVWEGAGGERGSTTFKMDLALDKRGAVLGPMQRRLPHVCT